MSKTKNAIGFLACVVIAFGAATVGSIASIHAADFYRELVRPTWAPPARVFGPVWTALYFMMAIASWLVWKERSSRGGIALTVYGIQLVLNALWSWIFFAWRQGGWALVEIVVLWVGILATILLFWRIRRTAAILLVPYFLWVSFASCLTYALWRLNPDML